VGVGVGVIIVILIIIVVVVVNIIIHGPFPAGLGSAAVDTWVRVGVC